MKVVGRCELVGSYGSRERLGESIGSFHNTGKYDEYTYVYIKSSFYSLIELFQLALGSKQDRMIMNKCYESYGNFLDYLKACTVYAYAHNDEHLLHIIHDLNNIIVTLDGWICSNIGTDEQVKVALDGILHIIEYFDLDNVYPQHACCDEVIDSVVRMMQINCNFKIAYVVAYQKKHIIYSLSKPRLYSIILNIVKNAVDELYAHNTGEITIYVKSLLLNDKEYVQISINDNGRGIPRDRLPFLFEKGYTLKNVSDGKIHGYGLLFVKNEIERAGGSIRVDSEVGLGTCVLVILPVL